MASSVTNKYTIGLGIGLIIFASYILLRLFRDPVKQELRYAASTFSEEAKLSPPNTDFALTIDKIGASSAIVGGVDPFNSLVYQKALSLGVAHALGTKRPGEGGNIFLFAHSSADLLTSERYNSVFYLMHHLEPGDIIRVWYQGTQYDYAVTDKKLVSAGDIQYLNKKTNQEQLTLMTCWPPGTTLKRLIIVAKPLPL